MREYGETADRERARQAGFAHHLTKPADPERLARLVTHAEPVTGQKEKVSLLRDIISLLGRRLGQLAMYFDAPPPSVEIIDLSGPPPAPARARAPLRRASPKRRPTSKAWAWCRAHLIPRRWSIRRSPRPR